MSTHSTISIENDDGTITGVYCHFDGYPSNNGVLLKEHYTTEQAIRKLLHYGDMSSLEKNVDDIDYYGKDRGETDTEATTYKNIQDLNDTDTDYIYLYTRDKKWVCLNNDASTTELDVAIANDN